MFSNKNMRSSKFPQIIGLFAIFGLGFLLFPTATHASIEFFVNKGEIIRLTNEFRIDNGLHPLVENGLLSLAAAAKTQDMLKNDYFAHISPDGKYFDIWIEEANYNYTFAGENLARDFLGSRDVFTAWLESPAHRQNILDEDFQEIGLAIAEGKSEDKDTILIVQLFGARKDFELSQVAAAKIAAAGYPIGHNQKQSPPEQLFANWQKSTTASSTLPSETLPVPMFLLSLGGLGLAIESLLLGREKIGYNKKSKKIIDAENEPPLFPF